MSSEQTAGKQSKFQKFDRVRVKFGCDRGQYGTIVHVGGDDWTYYGVKLDCHPNTMGYSEYELAGALPRPTRPLWQYEGQQERRGVYVPKEVAMCPECQGELTARSMEWEEETGRPIATGIELECITYLSHESNHRWHQSDWQPVRDAVAKWCDARMDIGPPPNPPGKSGSKT